VADEIPVQRRGGEQRHMVTDPRTRAVQDQHPVGAERGAYPVRDDDQRARPGGEGVLGPGRRRRVQVTGGLIEDGQPGR
jgi:hypothetical protein